MIVAPSRMGQIWTDPVSASLRKLVAASRLAASKPPAPPGRLPERRELDLRGTWPQASGPFRIEGLWRIGFSNRSRTVRRIGVRIRIDALPGSGHGRDLIQGSLGRTRQACLPMPLPIPRLKRSPRRSAGNAADPGPKVPINRQSWPPVKAPSGRNEGRSGARLLKIAAQSGNLIAKLG
jgi:hypothetical protein